MRSIAAWFLLKRDRFPFWKAADMAGFAVATGLGFGRMGCLLAGCCFGLRNDGPLGLVFPGGSPASESQFKAHLLTSMKEPSLRSRTWSSSPCPQRQSSLARCSPIPARLESSRYAER